MVADAGMTTMLEAIINYGYSAPRAIIADGTVKRFATDATKRHSKDGWYVCHDDANGKAGAFGSWRDGSSISWSNGTGRQLTREEWAEIEKHKKAVFDEVRLERADAALRAQRVYAQAETEGQSNYLTRKGITLPDGVRFISNMPSVALGYKSAWTITGMLVPVFNPAGDIMSLQIITNAEADNKSFLKNGATSGGWFAVGDWQKAQCVVIAEGLATSQSIYEASGHPCVTAFNAGNLPKVAAMVRNKNALAKILLAVDGDKAGREASEKAAKQVNAELIEAPDGMDWNDVHVAEGLGVVRKAFVTDEITDLWKADLIVKNKSDGTQSIPCRAHNLILTLRNDLEFKGRIRLNELSNQLCIDGRESSDADITLIKAAFEKRHISDRVSTTDVLDALGVVAAENAFHPVREYLSSLTWDGKIRVVNLFSEYYGAEDTDYNAAVSNSFLVSSVARIMSPGCQVDTAVILEGGQGNRKSSSLSTLFSPSWHSEITASVTDKDFYQNLRGKWCMEFGELSAFKKSDAAHIKQIITARYDNYRASYARFNKDNPRHCIFTGSTNEQTYLTDPTGGRRFLPVVCKRIDIEAIQRDRDQLWAEALARYKSGATWWDIPDAQREQDKRFQEDSWENNILYWLDDIQVKHMLETKTLTTSVILSNALGIDIARHDKSAQTRVGAIMTRLGFKRKQCSTRNIRYYQRI